MTRAFAATALSAVALALALAGCSSSGGGLIPASDAGPLRADFQRVQEAAEKGNGKCGETEAALSQTEVDFSGLPAAVNSELRATLRRGIANLKLHALALCTQPLPQPTTTTPAPTAPTTSTPTTQTTPAPTTPRTSTTETSGEGGGTPAGEDSEPNAESGSGDGGGGAEPGAEAGTEPAK